MSMNELAGPVLGHRIKSERSARKLRKDNHCFDWAEAATEPSILQVKMLQPQAAQALFMVLLQKEHEARTRSSSGCSAISPWRQLYEKFGRRLPRSWHEVFKKALV